MSDFFIAVQEKILRNITLLEMDDSDGTTIYFL